MLVLSDHIVIFNQIASDSVKVYKAVSDGTLNLVDKVSCKLGY